MSAATFKTGKLQLILGPMFSGKSSEMMRRVKRYQLCNHKCLIIRYANDTRYTDEKLVTTHDGRAMKAVSAMTLKTLERDVFDVDVIGIDEGQFFPDAVEFCTGLLQRGKIIVVAGLDGTFKRSGFFNILNLIPMAHSVEKLSAICMCCGKKASFTKRIGTETEIEVIGGVDKYLAVCRECFKDPRSEKMSPFKRMERPRVFNVIDVSDRGKRSCKRRALDSN